MYVATFLFALSATGVCAVVGPGVPADSPRTGGAAEPVPVAHHERVDREPESRAPWTVLPDESVFAVVTEKAGFAARLAHNHLIVSRDYSVTLDFDPERPGATTFEFEARVADLIVDDQEERLRWEAGIVALDLVSELGSPGEDDLRKIREEMLAEGQLDAENHPTLSARLISVREEVGAFGTGSFGHMADVEVRIRDQTVQRAVAVRFEIDPTDPNRASIEAVGQFTFEDFGIEPYSAFLGSVKNKNEFYIYLNLKAVR